VSHAGNYLNVAEDATTGAMAGVLHGIVAWEWGDSTRLVLALPAWLLSSRTGDLPCRQYYTPHLSASIAQGPAMS